MAEVLRQDRRAGAEGHRDLLRVVALPVTWRGRDPAGVAEVLLDEMMAMLDADVAWVRLDGVGRSRTEHARSALAADGVERMYELVRRIEHLPVDPGGLRVGASGPGPGASLRFACVPIGPDGAGGLLAVASVRSDFPTESERLLLRIAAVQAWVGLESALLVERCAQAAQDGEILHRISDGLNRATRLEDVFAPALDGIRQALRTDRAAIMLVADSGRMRFVAWRGLSDAYLRAFDGQPSPWEADDGARGPILYGDVEARPDLAEHRETFRAERVGAVACLPLVYDDRVLGSLVVCFEGAHGFDDREVQLASTIASDVAQAVGRHQAEIENASLVADLQRNLRFSELFVGVLGHDLRNPLFAIKAAAWLISRPVSRETVVDVAQRISDSANRMSRMIDQVLDFTRLRLGGEIPITCEIVDLDEVVRGVADELHTVDGTRDLALSTVGHTRGEWDRDRLAQMFSNLLGNAYQHGVPGTPIELRLDGTSANGVTAEIRSAGEIEPERLADLFEPLRARARNRKAAGSSGLGLGLFICRQIALAHGGTIRAESEHGTTRFLVQLPRRPPTSGGLGAG